MMPSHARLMTTAGTPAAVRAPSSQPENRSMRVLTPSWSQEPKGPKVMTNITSMAHRNRGRAVYLPVTIRSIFSVRVGPSEPLPFTTEARTTRSI